ncbi:MAG: zeta toxin family protein [Tannerellaceae bacterium]|jgi:predicted ABC-type ATPase|nr:zeta toxin family protein [Tannerellaceae bacterium]
MTNIGDGYRPKLLVVAGPNGSGKTSVTGEILMHEWVRDCRYINPDFIAQEMFGNWNSAESVMKAARYATRWRERCVSKGESMIFETVFSAPDKLSFIRRAKDKVFFIRLFFIGTDGPEINISRWRRGF